MRILAPLSALLVAAALAPPLASAAIVDPAIIDTNTTSVNDIGVAPDGSGALVYTKAVAAETRVMVSLLTNGTWSAPITVDPDGGTEDAPRVAVANGGRVLVGYRAGTAQFLRWRLKQSGQPAFDAEQTISDSGAANRIGFDWDLDMNPTGVAYAGWSQFNPVTMKRDARAWRLEGTTGTLIPTALQQTPAAEGVNDAGNGPDIRIGVDDAGNGTIQWGQSEGAEFGAYVRRIAGTTPDGTAVNVEVSAVYGEALNGATRQMDLDVAGDGTAWATGNAMYPMGGHGIGVPVTGPTAGTFAVLDGYDAAATDNVERPDVSLNAAGQGLFASEPNTGAGVFGGTISGTTASAASRLDSVPHEPAKSEVPVAAIGDNGGGLVAWTRDTAGTDEIRANYYNGTAFEGDTLMVTDATVDFAVSAADGAGASRNGDVAVLGLRDPAAAKTLVVGVYDAPPTAPVASLSADGASINWTAAEDLWGGIASYKVVIDDAVVATLGGAELTYTPSGLAAGDHAGRIVAVDSRGQETSSPAVTITVAGGGGDGGGGDGGDGADTTDPVISKLRQTRKRWKAGKGTTFKMTLSERSTLAIEIRKVRKGKPPKKVGTLTRRGLSGKAKVRFKGRIKRKALKPGKYVARFQATDAAGNRSKRPKLKFTVVKR